MKTRVISGAVLTALLIVWIYFSSVPYIMNTVVALLSALAVYEVGTAINKKGCKIYMPFCVAYAIGYSANKRQLAFFPAFCACGIYVHYRNIRFCERYKIRKRLSAVLYDDSHFSFLFNADDTAFGRGTRTLLSDTRLHHRMGRRYGRIYGRQIFRQT